MPRLEWFLFPVALFFVFCLYSLGLVYFYQGRVYPRVYLADRINLAGYTAEEALELMDVLEQKQVSVFVGGQRRDFTLTDLGVGFNREQILTKSFAFGRGQNLSWRLPALLSLLIQGGSVDLGWSFDHEKFDRSVKALEANLWPRPESPSLTLTADFQLALKSGTAGWQIDENDLEFRLEESLANSALSAGDLSFQTKLIWNKWEDSSYSEETLLNLQKQIEAVVADSVVIYFTDRLKPKTKSELTLKRQDLLEALKLPTAEQPDFAFELEILRTKLKPFAQSLETQDRRLDETRTLAQIGGILQARKDSVSSDFIRLIRKEDGTPAVLAPQRLPAAVLELPGTYGNLAEKYLEVDKSLQKLFQWEKGALVGIYVISTGKFNPTPSGEFKIMNKYQLAWSNIAQVWMPFWMAFTFDKNVGAYLGFHELPYWKVNGQIVRRPFDTLGEPVTGGCIQLNIGEAEKIFAWAEPGMLVVIHE